MSALFFFHSHNKPTLYQPVHSKQIQFCFIFSPGQIKKFFCKHCHLKENALFPTPGFVVWKSTKQLQISFQPCHFWTFFFRISGIAKRIRIYSSEYLFFFLCPPGMMISWFQNFSWWRLKAGHSGWTSPPPSWEPAVHSCRPAALPPLPRCLQLAPSILETVRQILVKKWQHSWNVWQNFLIVLTGFLKLLDMVFETKWHFFGFFDMNSQNSPIAQSKISMSQILCQFIFYKSLSFFLRMLSNFQIILWKKFKTLSKSSKNWNQQQFFFTELLFFFTIAHIQQLWKLLVAHVFFCILMCFTWFFSGATFSGFERRWKNWLYNYRGGDLTRNNCSRENSCREKY